jgi:hypothetical protein
VHRLEALVGKEQPKASDRPLKLQINLLCLTWKSTVSVDDSSATYVIYPEGEIHIVGGKQISRCM